jgi:asparagine synthase (glutamine-hydrolysing)
MAAHYRLSVHRTFPEAGQALHLLRRVVRSLDQPFESPVCVVNYMLMGAAREAGVKVVLNGHGSDELLCGYTDAMLEPYLRELVARGRLVGALREAWAFGSVTRSLVTARLSALRPRRHDRRAPAARDLFTGVEMVRQFDGRDGSSWAGALRRRCVQLFSQQLIPQWLRMEDRMSMAWSVESRLPFMDYRVVEWVLGMPAELKLHAGYGKYALRAAMAGMLPSAIAWDRWKRRFSLPSMATWFRTGWRPLIEEVLLTPGGCLDGLVDRRVFAGTIRAWLDGDDGATRPQVVWRCLNAALWLEDLRKRS